MTNRPIPTQPPILTPQLGWTLACLGAIALACTQLGMGGDWLNLQGWPQLAEFLGASLTPDLSLELLQIAGQATLTTLAYAVCGTTLSLLMGMVGGLVLSEVWWRSLMPQRSSQRPPPFWFGLRAAFAVPRAIHELLWGLFLINLWGLDPLTAILAIAIPYSAIVAKVFAEILDETPRQPLLALLNSGVNPLSAILYGLLPPAGLNLVSYSFYRFECSIRSAAVLGLIGAGGLGHEIFLSLQSLRYPQLWTFFYALIILNGAVDLSSAWVRRSLGCANRMDLNQKRPTQPRPRTETRLSLAPSTPVPLAVVGLGLTLLVLFCFSFVGADFSRLTSAQTLTQLRGMLQDLWLPDAAGVSGGELMALSVQTLAMSVLAIAIAGLGGILVSFLATHTFFLPGGLFWSPGQDQTQRLTRWMFIIGTRFTLLTCRAIPAPIWALVALFVLFPGILPGAIALGLYNFGILGRLMTEVNENLDHKPLEALQAQGASRVGVFLYGVLPLTLPRFLAYTFYRWEVCTRETIIVGLVGAGGLGRLLTEQLSSFDASGVFVTLGCFVVLTLGVDWVSGTMRRALR